MKTNLKQKTREWLQKKYNAIVGNVEYWNRFSKKTNDLMGLFDIIAIFNHALYGIQITSDSHFSAHHKKMIENKNLFYWLDTDNFAWLISWHKKKIKRGGKKIIWVPKIREYYLMDYREVKDRKHSKLKVNNEVVVWEEKNYKLIFKKI